MERFEHRCINVWLLYDRSSAHGPTPANRRVKITNHSELLDVESRCDDGDSLIRHHCTYWKAVTESFTHTDEFGLDEGACIAYVNPYTYHDWIGSRITNFNKWTMHSAQAQLRYRMRHLEGTREGQSGAHVISFNGDSGSGKSTIIRELQSLDGDDVNIARQQPHVTTDRGPGR